MVCGMSTTSRLTAFALVLALAFGVGAALGAVAGPIDVGGGDHGRGDEPHQTGDPDAGTHDTGTHDTGTHDTGTHDTGTHNMGDMGDVAP
jgi:hypothetical protein